MHAALVELPPELLPLELLAEVLAVELVPPLELLLPDELAEQVPELGTQSLPTGLFAWSRMVWQMAPFGQLWPPLQSVPQKSLPLLSVRQKLLPPPQSAPTEQVLQYLPEPVPPELLLELPELPPLLPALLLPPLLPPLPPPLTPPVGAVVTTKSHKWVAELQV